MGFRQNTVTGEPFNKQILLKVYEEDHATWTKVAASRNISLNEMIRVTMRKECLDNKPKEECRHLRILSHTSVEDNPDGVGTATYICKLCGEKL